MDKPKKQKSRRILLTLPPELLDEVQQYCEENKYNRAEFIRYALRAIIHNDGKSNQ